MPHSVVHDCGLLTDFFPASKNSLRRAGLHSREITSVNRLGSDSNDYKIKDARRDFKTNLMYIELIS